MPSFESADRKTLARKNVSWYQTLGTFVGYYRKGIERYGGHRFEFHSLLAYLWVRRIHIGREKVRQQDGKCTNTSKNQKTNDRIL
jgi:hypothetical protein